MVLNTRPANAGECTWVRTGVTGRLICTPDAEGDRVLDFSNARYMGRGLGALPNDVPTVLAVSPISGEDADGDGVSIWRT